MNNLKIILLIFLLVLISCSNNKKKISTINEIRQDEEMISTYIEAKNALIEGDPYFAANKFLEAELLFPQSEWASRSALMASYSFYLFNSYNDALSNLERFIITYPKSKDLVYAHYLIAICYYETIVDEKRDIGPLLKAQEKFNFILNKFPNTTFAIDAKFKIGLIQDVLASKEMYLGRYYLKKKKWIASMNRFKNVLNQYDQTIFAKEALHRLVEINYHLGLEEEAKKYATVLGYNYLSSDWYKKTYIIFNDKYIDQTYNKIEKDKNRNKVIDKFKKLFN